MLLLKFFNTQLLKFRFYINFCFEKSARVTLTMLSVSLLFRPHHLRQTNLRTISFTIIGLLLLGGCSSESVSIKEPNISTSVRILPSNLVVTKPLPLEKQLLPISSFPKVIPVDCGDGQAKLFDECADQTEILNEAIVAAKQEGKHVLVSYGGEWCIWCHVLDRYFKGQFRTFDYQWRDSEGDISEWLMREDITPKDVQNAIALSNYVANHFVIAHIDNSYANGEEAIAMTGLDPDSVYYYPYIIVLDNQGKYAGEMASSSAIEGLEVRESGGQEFRGYKRDLLLEQLKELKIKAGAL